MDHDRDEPVVLGALRDEKNPAVRGYVAGLVRQVEAICERHGAKAADLGKKETQDILTTAELSLVRKLVARILGMRTGELSSDAKGEILRDLEAREAAAREEYEKYAEVCGRNDKIAEVVKLLLKENLLDEAFTLISKWNPDNPFARVEYLIYLARDHAKTDLIESQIDIATAINQLQTTEYGSSEAKIPLYMKAYDVHLSLLSDKQMAVTAAVVARGDSPFKRIEMERISTELKRRGLPADSLAMAELRAVIEEEEDEKTHDERLHSDLMIAKIRHDGGSDPVETLSSIVDMIREDDDASIEFDICFVADLAGGMGALSIVEELQNNRWWADDSLLSSLWTAAAFGSVRVGNTTRAVEILRAHPEIAAEKYDEYIYNAIANRMLDDGDFDGAERFVHEFPTLLSEDDLHNSVSYLVAKARVGEDVLDEAKLWTIHDMVIAPDGPAALSHLRVPIATIGYTVAMRKRIAEYATKL